MASRALPGSFIGHRKHRERSSAGNQFTVGAANAIIWQPKATLARAQGQRNVNYQTSPGGKLHICVSSGAFPARKRKSHAKTKKELQTNLHAMQSDAGMQVQHAAVLGHVLWPGFRMTSGQPVRPRGRQQSTGGIPTGPF
ncbi:Biotin-protein ligase [Anopheles sinensis]|uniref:Biotin-protein ligase n=1 Tax=Anopheles sinensis TaxID=74873 RepID=A0A084W8K2_ANOSI|nr:Biotin-protein ligase [Anopheles sinensis]